MSQYSMQNDQEIETRQRTRNGYFILGILMPAMLLAGGLFAYIGYAYHQPRLYTIAGMLAVNLVIDIWLLSVIRKGNTSLAMGFVMALFLMDALAIPLIIQNMGMIMAVSAALITMAIAGLTLPRKYQPLGLVSGILAGILAVALDMQLGSDRITVPLLETYTPIISAGIIILIILVSLPRFKDFGLRVKVALGILITGAITVSTLTIFVSARAQTVIDTLSQKYEKSIAQQIEAQVSYTSQIEADKADRFFAEVLRNMQVIAGYRANLETRRELFSEGAYWNAGVQVFRMTDGQYGNLATEPASIFIPSIYSPDEAMLADLNVTAQLDFIVLDFLKTNPRVGSVYYMSETGATTYYPNIDLARSVPPDFDIKQQVFYTIANPQNDPQRTPRWTPAYQDPAGTGLIITLSIPVYVNDEFKGVMSADLKISQLAETIYNINLGEDSFAFLINSEGHVIAMPLQGYLFFGITPEQTPANESPKQSIMGRGSEKLRDVSARIVSGEKGLAKIENNGIETYISFIPLRTPGFRLAIVAPAKELSREILANREETQNQLTSTLQGIINLLLILFVLAFLISIWIGRIIANPLVNLTKTVEQIAAGDLSARAPVQTRDETGRLAASFNIMSDKLKNILASLEERISARTQELEISNKLNARRAAQFETIARVARTISSTQTLETLLPQIVENISKQFNFYHVGIFLLDNRHEYAILVAANSEGGQRMLARNHRLMVGETGIVGYVTSVGQPRVALDVGTDATYFNNPDLPNTHSEIALPLRIGADTFGALDVQSTERNAFTQEDINILATLADQVSIAIQNARSYQQSRDALAQAERVSYQLSGQQWRRFVEQQVISGYHFDGADTTELKPGQHHNYNLSIPLTLRGARIGSIKINASDPNHEWSDDELAMIQAAADRASLALENARLLEESQKRAAKERTIGEISAKIGSVTGLEDIIETAMQELGKNLPHTDIAVQFTDASAK